MISITQRGSRVDTLSRTFSNPDTPRSDTFASEFSMREILTPSSSSTYLSLSISHNAFAYSFSVPQAIHRTVVQLREKFLSALNRDLDTEISSKTELAARFLGFIADGIEQEEGELQEIYTKFLAITFDAFEHDILHGNEIHAVIAAQEFSSEERSVIIEAFFRAQFALGRPNRATPSALLRAAGDGKASIYAIFGGQGNDEKYFDELREVYTTYGAILQDLIPAAALLLQQLAEDERFKQHYPQGLDILEWMDDEERQPDTAYLISAPVSFPLIGLLQLAHYNIACHVLGQTPRQMHEFLSGTTGHSQGIVIATMIAAAESWKSFHRRAQDALTILLSIGARSQEMFATATLPPSIVADAEEQGEGSPTPMLSIRDVPVKKVKDYVEKINGHLLPETQVQLSLINGPHNVVVSGPPLSLHGLNLFLRSLKAPKDLNQAKVLFSQRKSKITNRFLPITVPFHSSYLSEVAYLVEQDLEDISISSRNLGIPVFTTNAGDDLRLHGSSNIVPELIRMITQQPLMWEQATKFPNATHIIEFGPGGISGIGPLTNKNKEGSGVRTILTTAINGPNRDIGYKSEIFNRDFKHGLIYGSNWGEKYAPRLTRNVAGQTFVDTKMSRLLGLPPIMVGGMTPTTVSWEFVAATMAAGYHIELALGGYHNAGSLTEAIDQIVNSVTPGRGITCNIIYASPHAVRWQIPLLTQLREKGVPIEGLTIGAGVPSLEVANSYISDMGLKHIAFKPGSLESIQQVIDIARANPTFPIMLQWTGGRGGGHHSFEDFHQPILQMYGRIRSCDNIVLIAGSGFGSAEDTYPYITGDWSTHFNCQRMPFDGILLGSRVMVAKETKTSAAAKKAIVDAPGVKNCDWEQTYKAAAGGVITVMSEMGEPIHKLATRGIRLWSEMDKTIFNLDKSKRVAALHKKKDYIIRRLNADFQKVWFGRNSSGRVVDLEEMTYSEVVFRLIDLLYVEHEGRWIHNSLKVLVYDFLLRVESRFVSSPGQISAFRDANDLDQPHAVVRAFFDGNPKMADQLIGSQDAQYFLAICKRSGQKPVPFIPALNEDFEIWFKKDSLWQSEDLQAVVDQDVGRVCILQGPVAARWSKKVDEPIKQIMDSIHLGHIASILSHRYEDQKHKVPVVGCFGLVSSDPAEDAALDGMNICKQETSTLYELSSSTESPIPGLEEWLGVLGGAKGDWRQAFFKTRTVVQGRKFCENPVRRLFQPTHGSYILIDDKGGPRRPIVSLFECGKNVDPVKVVEIRVQEENVIVLEILDDRNAEGNPIGLVLKYSYHPEASFAPIREIMEGRNDRIKDFYHRLWFAEEMKPKSLQATINDTFHGGHFVVKSDSITKFAQCIGNSDDAFSKRLDKKLYTPMDFAVVVAWKALMQPLFSKDIDVDLLKLVHLSNGFRLVHGAEPIREGDVLETKSHIAAIINQDSGKLVEVHGQIFREGQAIVDLTSQFLCRGTYVDYENTFQRVEETLTEIHLKTPKDVAILKAKSWFQMQDPPFELLNQKLHFRLKSIYYFKDKGLFSVKTTGEVKLIPYRPDSPPHALVDYDASGLRGNPVTDYLQRHGTPVEPRVTLENPVPIVGQTSLVVQMPASNEAYAYVSGDFNPIHISKSLSKYVNLPGTITHGMYTSARVRSLVERWICASNIELFRSFTCSFTRMVLPNDEIEVKFQHVGMVSGRKIIKVEAIHVESKETVLLGEAEIEPSTTAYLFTGQGSQQKGMGMELYASSQAARSVWDYADAYFYNNYGFKITDIVRDDPKELTIYFGGPRGRHIRDVYMSMKHESIAPDGTIKVERIFKDIDENATSHTFRSATGLLSATQFTQPALTLMEIAIFADLQARGLVSKQSSFAGHSLGEYAALCAVGGIMSVESLVSVVFYRGLTMQVAVERDEQNRSNFAMCAVDPSRLSNTFNEDALQFIVRNISKESNWLLEIVNFNIADMQYVCAGELRALECMSNVLNIIKEEKIDLQVPKTPPFTNTQSVSEVQGHVLSIIRECAAGVLVQSRSGHIELKRGKATIPLQGVDVPFHSSFLKPGVSSFRKHIQRHIKEDNLDPSKLIGKYVPNLTARPFEVTKEYFEYVLSLTDSVLIRKVLSEWDEFASHPARLTKILSSIT